ncbi:diguanylate cyclase [Chitinispirillales bacterium ANBcel5]|uniref:GGDEF domain-containing response regulator n=1 Tax=Cellulosispirillum alkaliphilum TaxID=3039283 RepID=UPI002A5340BD|nr:diguanylate cyclase [Chitinispirillales bacterium ANBcel5]
MSTITLVKRPSECTILIVDDEELVCQLLKTTLSSSYKVMTCNTGSEAIALIEKHYFDVVIVDLKLPDMPGTEIIGYAKNRDEFCEVIMITGHATVDSATTALNMGAVSYLTKPFEIEDLLLQVEKAVASRLFHLKSLMLMKESEQMEPGAKEHLFDITSLYFFTRKIMLSLEVTEIMRIVLDEANTKCNAYFCAVGVDILGYKELYAMPRFGDVSEKQVRDNLLNFWNDAFPFLTIESFRSEELPLYFYKGREGKSSSGESLQCLSVPMIISGKTIGTIAVVRNCEQDLSSQNEFLHIFTSLVSSVIEHAYSDLQARVQAKTDSLTGIANHRQFHEALEREIARANRHKGVFALILADIDDFKSINDTYGHQIGDAVIIDLTRRLCANIRSSDVASRYGGEEFSLILPDSDENGAHKLAQRICRQIADEPFVSGKTEFFYTVSFGVAVYDGRKPLNKDVLISRADEALYTSKRKGKNQVNVSDKTI